MKRQLVQIISSLWLVSTFARSSFAAFPMPGDDPRERHILPFRSSEYNTNICKDNVLSDNERLAEILSRRVGPDLAEKHYERAIARLSGLLNAVQRLPSVQDSRSSLLGYITLGYTKMQDRHRATQVLQIIPNRQIQRQWRSHFACYR